jgi:hypothetical protein
MKPIEYFERNKKYLFEKKLQPEALREFIYTKSRECSTHNPLIIAYFIRALKAKKILDMSCGWGDRLIGSLAAGVDLYYGCDPNSCLHKGYQQIIDLLRPYSPNPKAQITINCAPFESHTIPEELGQFDLMYTSPPYFDYEDYSKETTQSIASSEILNEDQWLNKFLYPSVKKIISRIKPRGHIIFYFSQGPTHGYMEKFLKWMKNDEQQVDYLGNVFFGKDRKRVHPIFIWRKRSE